MDFEAAIETQRDALLRHLASLFAVVRFLSFGPFASRLPRWVRSLIVYLLRPAEAAADCLVEVMAGVLARSDGEGRLKRSLVTIPRLTSDFDRAELDGSVEDIVSSNGLIGRMEALRDKLENIEAYALRLMRQPTVPVARRYRRARPAQPLRASTESGPFLRMGPAGVHLVAPFAPP